MIDLYFVYFFALAISAYLLTKGYMSVAFFSLYYIAVSIYSFLGMIVFEFATEVPYNFYGKVSKTTVIEAIKVFAFLALSFSLGALLTALIKKRAEFSGKGFERLAIFLRRHQLAVIFISVLSSIVMLYSFGLADFWSRTGYESSNLWQVGKIFSRIMLPISSFFIAFIGKRGLRWSVFIFAYFVFFGLTSRAMIFVPFFYCIGCYIRYGRIGSIRFLFMATLILFSAASALDMRTNEQQGLYNNLSYVIGSGVDIGELVVGVNYVVAYSVAYLAYIIENVSYDSSLFWLAINPLPGSFIDIDRVASEARIAPRIPYSAVGEVLLMLHSGIYVVYFLLGLGFAYIEATLKRRSMLFYALFSVTFLMLCLVSTQYNLRGSMRLLYYCIFLFFLYILIFNSRILMRKK